MRLPLYLSMVTHVVTTKRRKAIIIDLITAQIATTRDTDKWFTNKEKSYHSRSNIYKKMELRFSSKEIEQRLLELFSSKTVVVQSIDPEGCCLYVGS